MEKYDAIMGPGGAMEAAQEALEDGRVRHIGFSSHNLETALRLVATDDFETVQFPFNFISNEAAQDLVPLAAKHDVGFISMKPFAGGMIKEARLAIKYLLQFENVLPDPGIEKNSDIEGVIDVVNGDWGLTTLERQEMHDFRSTTGARFYKQCEYCMPCPQGVRIHRMTYLQRLYELWPPERYFTWPLVLDAVESAPHCTKCGECETKCPYQLPIREMIDENLEFHERMAREHAMA